MIRRHSQGIRPSSKAEAKPSLLGARLIEAYERHKAANEAKSG
jgi:hypothetical protein